MKYLAVILFLINAASAHAGCLQWGRSLNDNSRVCMVDDAVNRKPVVPESGLGILGTTCGSSMGCSGVFSSPAPPPKCPDGYSLILRDLGKPACARDIIDPQ